MKDLDELKRLLAAATPGPWGWDTFALVSPDDFDLDDRNVLFMFAAVNALPDLIAEIEMLELAARRNQAATGAIEAAHQMRVADLEEQLVEALKLLEGYGPMQAHIERLEAALREIAKLRERFDADDDMPVLDVVCDMADIARVALDPAK